ncbi:hypothetical protein ACLVWU_06205 [Bdellovibrio sp. HCB290]|uniref:hypothetical protein n=1 Tax=Bdellovibrio sp. HCB290 TaxID=3394356 RepID=UPI0039B546E8
MKLADIVKVVANELGTSDLKEINKLLKAEPAVKFRITGKALGHFGFTGQIKSLSEEGIKAFMANKVSLIRLADIESFEKAKPRAERPVRTAKAEASPSPVPAKALPKKAKAPAKPSHDIDEDDEDFDDDDGFEDDEELRPKKLKKGKPKAAGKSGSKFIPSFKK